MNVVEFIAAKRDGRRHSPAEIEGFVSALLSGEATDYQAAAWLMAAYLRGLNASETAHLADSMATSGRTFPFGHFGPHSVDKHSTGGVGDKTTLVVAPLCAALGAAVPKMSGRGLGFTGGTLDKLESIPGFRTDLTPSEFENTVRAVGVAVAAQSHDLVPADGLLYALRDVTATVDSTPLIAASIMSKKLAIGCPAIVLDVKVGSGAFMPDLESGRALAQAMLDIGREAGRRTIAILSDMSQPLGRAVGNALEVCEAVETLRGGGPADFAHHCLLVGAEMLVASGLYSHPADAGLAAQGALGDGRAFAKLEEMVAAQHGSAEALTNDGLPISQHVLAVSAEKAGYVESLDAREIGVAAMALGAGRKKKGDSVDLSAGIVLHAKIGDRVEPGQPLAEIHASDASLASGVVSRVRAAFAVGDAPSLSPPPVYDILRA